MSDLRRFIVTVLLTLRTALVVTAIVVVCSFMSSRMPTGSVQGNDDAWSESVNLYQQGWPFLSSIELEWPNATAIGPYRKIHRSVAATAGNLLALLALAVGACWAVPRGIATRFSLATFLRAVTSLALSLSVVILAHRVAADRGAYLLMDDSPFSIPFEWHASPFPVTEWLSWRGWVLFVSLYGFVYGALGLVWGTLNRLRKGGGPGGPHSRMWRDDPDNPTSSTVTAYRT